MSAYRVIPTAYDVHSDRGIVRIGAQEFKVGNLFAFSGMVAIPTVSRIDEIQFELDCEVLYYTDRIRCWSPMVDEVPTTSLHVFQVLRALKVQLDPVFKDMPKNIYTPYKFLKKTKKLDEIVFLEHGVTQKIIMKKK